MSPSASISRRSIRRLVATTAVTALAVSVGPLASAHAAKPVNVSCGETITADTKLANDLTDCPNKGIIIGADNITLDLNGHTIDGDGRDNVDEDCPADVFCDTGVGNDGYEGVTITGGAVTEFGSGVFLFQAQDNRVHGLSTERNGDGMDAVLVNDAVMTQNSVDENVFGIFVVGDNVRLARNSVSEFAFGGGCGVEVQHSERVVITDNSVLASDPGAPITGSTCGIALLGDSTNSRVERNSISGNGFAGLLVEGGDHNLVTDNDISRSGEVGVSFIGDRGTITRNHVVDTVGGCEGCGAGISFEGGQGNLIANNTVERTQSTAGIQLAAFEPDTPPAVDNVARSNVVRDGGLDGIVVASTAADTLLERNLTINNADDGIDVENPGTTLTMNVANENQDLGIEALPGVIDGGGNRASGNGNSLQCTNVFCT
jgi:large repetitive protein